jgi:hypothetical protein
LQAAKSFLNDLARKVRPASIVLGDVRLDAATLRSRESAASPLETATRL